MNRVFGMDSPLMRFLSRITDIIILSTITMICCIPIITIGASITALHYMTIKMVKNEEGYIIRGFFKSFKYNFKQATIIWLLFIVVIVLFYLDYIIITHSTVELPSFVSIAIMALGIFLSLGAIYIFPVLSRFEGSIRNTIKNAYIMSIHNLPRTLLIALIYASIAIVTLLIPALLPLGIIAGPGLSAFLASYQFAKIFKRYEPKEDNDDSLDCMN